MADRSKIEWTDATWNPVRAIRKAARTDPMNGKVGWHCTHVSEGCRNCYAEAINKRLGTGLDYKPGHEKDLSIYLDEKMLTQPLRWKRARKIFVGSMTDLFGDFVSDDRIATVMAFVAAAYWHTFQILTKRPERMQKLFSNDQFWHMVDEELLAIDDEAEQLGLYNCMERRTDDWRAMCPDVLNGAPLANVWAGVSCEDQATADERIPHLLATPAAIRFLSGEPLLGLVDLTKISGPIIAGDEAIALPPGLTFNALTAVGKFGRDNRLIHQVICGGESGPHTRPMHPDWARALRDQCAEAGVPFFFKQWGEWAPERAGERAAYMITAPHAHGGDTSFVEWPKMQRFGKARAGRLLDGVEHNGMPAHP